MIFHKIPRVDPKNLGRRKGNKKRRIKRMMNDAEFNFFFKTENGREARNPKRVSSPGILNFERRNY